MVSLVDATELAYEEAQAAAGQGQGVRREGWDKGLYVIVSYVPAIKMALPLIVVDGWLTDAAGTLQQYNATEEDRDAKDWESETITLHPTHRPEGPMDRNRMN